MKKEYPREKVVVGLSGKFLDYVLALDKELEGNGEGACTNYEIDIAWGATKYTLYKWEDDPDDTGYPKEEEEKCM